MRVSEVYASVQGEGPRTGQTTVFVRFGGCNLRCPGWPCDTQHAIDPAFRKDWTKYHPLELAEEVIDVAQGHGANLITLTGGEPFLQNHHELYEFCNELLQNGFELEAFTNGTLEYPTWALEDVSMIVDWKLPGSGETRFGPDNATRLENLYQLTNPIAAGYSKAFSTQHSTKFVIKDMGDLMVAMAKFEAFQKSFPGLIWYYGKVWEGCEFTNAELVEMVMARQLPWRLNVQLHNYIWDPQERGR